MSDPARPSTRLTWAGYLIGFALGGFFDGILLHQILQWHHLLSLIDGVGDLRNQVLFDGLFHALMYVVAAVGLAMLLRSRGETDDLGAATTLMGNALIGFGSWHLLDGVLSHWLLGIHRIKLDSSNPMAWDLAWFIAFGAAPALAGWLMRRGGGEGGSSRGRGAAFGMMIAVLVGASWAAVPPARTDAAIAVFRPDMAKSAIMSAIVASGGALLWESRGLWAVQWEQPGRSRELYSQGALLVGSSFLAAGCLAWSKI